MSETSNQISDDIKTAMKARDSAALNALRALKSAITNAAIEKGGLGSELDEPETLADETAWVIRHFTANPGSTRR